MSRARGEGVESTSPKDRRPTKDIDAEAISVDVSPRHLKDVVIDVAAVDIDDGVEFHPATTTVVEIRDDTEYPGLRLKVTSYIHGRILPSTTDKGPRVLRSI